MTITLWMEKLAKIILSLKTDFKEWKGANKEILKPIMARN